MSFDPNYFDYASTCPPFGQSLDEFHKMAQTVYGNPSSLNYQGLLARHKLLSIKKSICDQVHFSDGRLLATASCTEANNLLILGYLKKYPKCKILMSRDVHDSLWNIKEAYPDNILPINIDKYGAIDLDHLETELISNSDLFCFSHVSNETGRIHNLDKITELCHKYNSKVFCDGAQAVLHLELNISNSNVDYYSFSGHKLGAVRGIAGVFIRDQDFEPLFYGGKQEWSLRPGTENLAGLSSIDSAMKIINKEKANQKIELKSLAYTILEKLELSKINYQNNSTNESVAGFLSLSFPNKSGSEIVAAMAMKGFSISTGSACHAENNEASRVLLAMGKSTQDSLGTIRISMGDYNTLESTHNLAYQLIDFLR